MNNQPIPRIVRVITACVSLAVTGCGSDAVELASVSGKVTMNGDPLPGATVIFRSQTTTGESTEQGAAAESYGKTNEEGRYQLSQVLTDNEGAVVGPNKVVITLDSFEAIMPAYDDSGKDGRGPNPIPPKYNLNSTLETVVPAEGLQDADFELINPDFKVPEQQQPGLGS